jgi:hypothetical protein
MIRNVARLQKDFPAFFLFSFFGVPCAWRCPDRGSDMIRNVARLKKDSPPFFLFSFF